MFESLTPVSPRLTSSTASQQQQRRRQPETENPKTLPVSAKLEGQMAALEGQCARQDVSQEASCVSMSDQLWTQCYRRRLRKRMLRLTRLDAVALASVARLKAESFITVIIKGRRQQQKQKVKANNNEGLRPELVG